MAKRSASRNNAGTNPPSTVVDQSAGSSSGEDVLGLSRLDEFNLYRNLADGYSCIITGARLKFSDDATKERLSEVLESATHDLVSKKWSLRSALQSSVDQSGKEVYKYVLLDEALTTKEGLKPCFEYREDEIISSCEAQLAGKSMKDYTKEDHETREKLNERLSSLFNELHQIKFKYSDGKHLWKIVVISSSWLFFICDHYIDGNSACFCVEDLVTIMDSKLGGEDGEHIGIFEETIPFTSNLHSQYKIVTKASVGLIVSTIFSLLTPEALRAFFQSIKVWFKSVFGAKFGKYGLTVKDEMKLDFLKNSSGLADRSDAKTRFEMIKNVITLGPEQLDAIQHVLKAHNSTVPPESKITFTGFVTYLSFKAISKIMKDKITNKKQKKGFSITLPVNLRPFMTSGRGRRQSHTEADRAMLHGLGGYIAAVKVPFGDNKNFNLDNEDGKINWELVEYVQSKLGRENIEFEATKVGLLELVKPEDFVKDSMSGEKKDILEISNLGLREGKDLSHVKVEEMIFSQPDNRLGTVLNVDVIGIRGANVVNVVVGVDKDYSDFFGKDFYQELTKQLSLK